MVEINLIIFIAVSICLLLAMSKDPPFIRKQKLDKRYGVDEFLPSEKKGWYTKESYKLKLHHRYRKNKDFRRAINNFKIYNKNKNKRIKKIFNQVIDNKENFIFEIIGLRRCGKSRLARKLILLYCHMNKANVMFHMDCFNLDENMLFVLDPSYEKVIKVYVTYAFDETEHILRTVFKEDDIIFQDEMPKSHGKGSKIMRDKLDNVLKIASGKKRINFMFLNPYLIELHEIDFYIQVLSINKRKKLTIAMLSTRTEDNKQTIYDGVITFIVEEPPELTVYYEEVSNEIKNRFKERGGSHTVQIKNKPFVDMLVKAVENSGEEMTSKDKLRRFARDIDEVRDWIGFEEVVSEVYDVIKKQRKNKKKFKYDRDEENMEGSEKGEGKTEENDKNEDVKERNNPGDFKKYTIEPEGSHFKEFEISLDEMLEGYDKRKTEIDNIRNINIYKKYMANRELGMTQEDLMEEFNLTQPAISVIIREVKGFVADRLGHEYEVYLKARYKAIFGDMIEKIECEGIKGANKPDMVLYLKDGRIYVISIKCYTTKKRVVSVPLKHVNIEIETTRKLFNAYMGKKKKIKCILHLYNTTTKLTVEKEINVDPEHVKKYYTVRFTKRER